MLTRKAAVEAVRKAKKGESKPDRQERDSLAKLIGRSEYKKALKHFKGMDTFVREGIPGDVIHFLQVKAAGGERIVTAHITLKDCKKVFKKGFRPGVIGQIELAFPKNIPDEKMGLAIFEKNAEVLDSMVEVVYREGDKHLVTMQAKHGF